ncbi:MAG TPA: hypothetical protein VFB54_19680 [Burkholderiales bacterium]|nr:hypothetical protein [Burkholderiales bacterium]
MDEHEAQQPKDDHACRLAGVFDSIGTAEHARELLIATGTSAGRITLSASLTQDGIAAESIGESFENQPGQADRGSHAETLEHNEARFNEAVRAGVCVLSMDIAAGEDSSGYERLMRDAGARSVWRGRDDDMYRLA